MIIIMNMYSDERACFSSCLDHRAFFSYLLFGYFSSLYFSVLLAIVIRDFLPLVFAPNCGRSAAWPCFWSKRFSLTIKFSGRFPLHLILSPFSKELTLSFFLFSITTAFGFEFPTQHIFFLPALSCIENNLSLKEETQYYFISLPFVVILSRPFWVNIRAEVMTHYFFCL